MNSLAIRMIVFACIFGATLFGMFLRRVLPEQHLSADSRLDEHPRSPPIPTTAYRLLPLEGSVFAAGVVIVLLMVAHGVTKIFA